VVPRRRREEAGAFLEGDVRDLPFGELRGGGGFKGRQSYRVR
jgi:hypothetical protein